MATHLDIAETSDGDHVILEVTGEIDLASAPDLESRLASLADRPSVVVDLSEVKFIDSTGLRVLISTHEAASSSERRFAIVAVDGPVTRLLSITGVHDWLNVYGDRASAIADA